MREGGQLDTDTKQNFHLQKNGQNLPRKEDMGLEKGSKALLAVLEPHMVWRSCHKNTRSMGGLKQLLESVCTVKKMRGKR